MHNPTILIVIGNEKNAIQASTAIPVSTLTAGALFGEIPQKSATSSSFVPPLHCCSALVRTDAELLRIDQADFANVLRVRELLAEVLVVVVTVVVVVVVVVALTLVVVLVIHERSCCD